MHVEEDLGPACGRLELAKEPTIVLNNLVHLRTANRATFEIGHLNEKRRDLSGERRDLSSQLNDERLQLGVAGCLRRRD